MIIGPDYGTPEWEKFRCGKVTASRFGDVLTEARSVPDEVVDQYEHLVSEPRYRRLKTGPNAGQEKQVEGYPALVREAMKRNGIYLWGDTANSYLLEVVASHFTQRTAVGGRSAAMDRGKDKEQDAIDRYVRDRFLDEDAVVGGRILQRDGINLCATPDSEINDDPEGPGILEVKCPDSKNHLAYWLAWRERVRNKLPHRPPDEYWEQVQGELLISERKWCDFISFDDRFPVPMQIVIARVYRDEDYIQSTLLPTCTAFAKRAAADIADIEAYVATMTTAQRDQFIQGLVPADPFT